jgi:hypothetical protein
MDSLQHFSAIKERIKNKSDDVTNKIGNKIAQNKK